MKYKTLKKVVVLFLFLLLMTILICLFLGITGEPPTIEEQVGAVEVVSPSPTLVPTATPEPTPEPTPIASDEPSEEPEEEPEETPYGQTEQTEEVPPSLGEEEQAKVPDWSDVASWDDVVRIAKTVSAEAGGIWNQTEQASVIWCILNRCDQWGQSISSVCVAGQFAYYSSSSTYDAFGRDLTVLVEDTLTQWAREKAGYSYTRTLPYGYIYFYGDGSHNWFSTSYPVNGGILYA